MNNWSLLVALVLILVTWWHAVSLLNYHTCHARHKSKHSFDYLPASLSIHYSPVRICIDGRVGLMVGLLSKAGRTSVDVSAPAFTVIHLVHPLRFKS